MDIVSPVSSRIGSTWLPMDMCPASAREPSWLAALSRLLELDCSGCIVHGDEAWASRRKWRVAAASVPVAETRAKTTATNVTALDMAVMACRSELVDAGANLTMNSLPTRQGKAPELGSLRSCRFQTNAKVDEGNVERWSNPKPFKGINTEAVFHFDPLLLRE
jgi:hypothetical protein